MTVLVALSSTSAQSSCVPQSPKLIQLAVVSCEVRDGISWITGMQNSISEEASVPSRMAKFVWINDMNPNCRGTKNGELISVYRYPKCCDSTFAIYGVESRPCDTEPYIISETP